jgi:putative endonuclease
MHWVYILRDEAGRHYIGITSNINARLIQHCNGGTQTTRRMTGELRLIAHRSFDSRHEAAVMERRLKSWKNPAAVVEFLTNTGS